MSQFSGTALFATRRGISVVGSGILKSLGTSAQLIEFRPHLEAESVSQQQFGFRKSVRDDSGGEWDLLGFVISGPDEVGRPGFYGASVAVLHGQIWLYQGAFDHACSLCAALADKGWASMAEKTAKHSRGDRATLRFVEQDETSEMVVLKPSPEFSEIELPTLCSLGVSQVLSVRAYEHSFFIINSEIGSDGEEVGPSLFQSISIRLAKQAAQVANDTEGLRAKVSDLEFANSKINAKNRQLRKKLAESAQELGKLKSSGQTQVRVGHDFAREQRVNHSHERYAPRTRQVPRSHNRTQSAIYWPDPEEDGSNKSFLAAMRGFFSSRKRKKRSLRRLKRQRVVFTILGIVLILVVFSVITWWILSKSIS